MIELLKNKEPSLFDFISNRPTKFETDSEPNVLLLASIITTAVEEYKQDLPKKIETLELEIKEKINDNTNRIVKWQKEAKLEELKQQLQDERDWLFCKKKDGVAFEDLCEMINDWLSSHGCDFNVSPRKIREQHGIV